MLTVDTRAGIIRGITIIPPKALKGIAADQACKLYESARVAIDGEQGVRNRIGILRNVRQSDEGSGAIDADLHCVTGHALWNQVSEIATRWPEDLNFSTRVIQAGQSLSIAGVGLSVQPTGGIESFTQVTESVQLTESAPLAPARVTPKAQRRTKPMPPQRRRTPAREPLLNTLGHGGGERLRRQLSGDGSRLARAVR